MLSVDLGSNMYAESLLSGMQGPNLAASRRVAAPIWNIRSMSAKSAIATPDAKMVVGSSLKRRTAVAVCT